MPGSSDTRAIAPSSKATSHTEPASKSMSAGICPARAALRISAFSTALISWSNLR